MKYVYSYSFFKDIIFKTALEDDGKSFFKLTVKIRPQIVFDGLSKNDYDVTNVGDHLSAKQWNEAINNGATVVDMRNHYESEIGRFEGAVCPDVETFKEELPKVKDLLKGKEKEQILLIVRVVLDVRKGLHILNIMDLRMLVSYTVVSLIYTSVRGK